MRVSLLLLTALLLSGCSQFNAIKDLATSVQGLITGTDNSEPPKELEPLETTVQLNSLWHASVGKGYNGQIVNLVPAVTDSSVYVGARKGEVEAFNRLTGDKVWSVETELELSSGPVVAGDKLLFGTSNAELIALSLADGSLQWKAVLTSEVLSLPRVRKNMVIVRTSDGRLAGLDLASGGVRWTHERSIPPLSVRGLGSPALTDDLVLDGFGGGKLIALGLLDGKPVWDTTVATPHGRSEVERLVELNADPLIRNDTVYVSGFQAGVSALNLQDGEMLWTQASVYSSHGLSAGRRSLFISDTNSDVWQLDISNGADMWKQSDLHQRRLTIPVPVKNRLVVGDFEGYLHVLSTDDGRLMGRLEVDDTPILAAPVIYNDVIYVYTTGGVLSALGMD